jgi:hypothetical protein
MSKRRRYNVRATTTHYCWCAQSSATVTQSSYVVGTDGSLSLDSCDYVSLVITNPKVVVLGVDVAIALVEIVGADDVGD